MNTFIANIWIKNNIKVLSNDSNISVYEFPILAWKEVEQLASRNINVNSSLGIYFLLNEDNKFYIGETESFFSRILDHYNKKAWVEKVIFININNVNKTELHILENKFIELFKNDAIYQLENANDGQGYSNKQAIYEQERTNSFYETSLKFLDILNIIPTTSKCNLEKNIIENELTFVFSRHDGNGEMVVKDNKYILKAGSKITKNIEGYVYGKAHEVHQKLISLYPDLILKEDFIYTSPSLLGSLISGGSVSGRKVWKEINSGKTLEEFFEN